MSSSEYSQYDYLYDYETYDSDNSSDSDDSSVSTPLNLSSPCLSDAENWSIERIITFRINPDKTKEYLVKFENTSYLHSKWLSSRRVRELSEQKLRNFNKKVGDDPQALHGDPDYAIRQEWLEIDRIIDIDLDELAEPQYLIKWCYLPYEDCTWELKSEYIASGGDVSRLKKSIDLYYLFERLAWTRNLDSPLDSSTNLPPITQSPTFVNGKLFPYQIEGVDWLRSCFLSQRNCILADEMGLGKTIQCITYLASLSQLNHFGPYLLVVPLSTIGNWEIELKKWIPSYYYVSFMGSASSRKVIIDYDWLTRLDPPSELSNNDIIKIKTKACFKYSRPIKFNIVLTAYDQIINNSALFKKINWTSIIVDEAHRLKNNQSKLFRTLSQFTSLHTVLLTGTPLQNTLEELFNLLHFLNPESFDCGVEETDRLRQAFIENDEEQIENFKLKFTAGSLKDRLKGMLLRRTKSDVKLKIPPKIERLVKIDLTPWQQYLYRAVLTKNYPALSGAIDAGRVSLGKSGKRSKASLQNVAMQLLKVCNHSFLVDPDLSVTDGDVVGDISSQEKSLDDDTFRRLVQASGKLLLLHNMLPILLAPGKDGKPKHRVLIFSQLVMMLDIIAEFLNHQEILFERLDGSIDKSERQRAIDRFNSPDSNCHVFLLSTLAGGLGINLASADTVVLFDSQWNPHHDLQALSRAHRIGQENCVLVLRLITTNSLEERIIEVGKKKLALENVVEAAHSKSRSQSNRLTLTDFDDVIKHGASDIFSKTNSIRSMNIEDDLKLNFSEEQFTKPCSNGKVLTFKDYQNLLDRSIGHDSNEEIIFDKSTTIQAGMETSSDFNFWDVLLKESYESSVKDELESLGKGQRTAGKAVDYNVSNQLSSSDSDSDHYDTDSDGCLEMLMEETPERLSKIYKLFDYELPSKIYLYEEDEKTIVGLSEKERYAFEQLLLRFGISTKASLLKMIRSSPHLTKTDSTLLITYAQCLCRYSSLLLIFEESNIEPWPFSRFPDGMPVSKISVEFLLNLIERTSFLNCAQEIIEKGVPFLSQPKICVFPFNQRYPWTFNEDVFLLEKLLEFGYSKWSDIGKSFFNGGTLSEYISNVYKESLELRQLSASVLQSRVESFASSVPKWIKKRLCVIIDLYENAICMQKLAI
ncbi:hypothetical protein P9112_011858 [Eukaryota sp. TZLM1-RC]